MHLSRPIIKLKYIANTASLYVNFRNKPSVTNAELSTGVVVADDADRSASHEASCLLTLRIQSSRSMWPT